MFSNAFFPCRLIVLLPTFYRKGTEMQGEICSRSQEACVVEMAKGQKQWGRSGSDLNRRYSNDSDITSIYTKIEMKIDCQDYLHYLFILFLILTIMWPENRIILTLNIVLYFTYTIVYIFLRDFHLPNIIPYTFFSHFSSSQFNCHLFVTLTISEQPGCILWTILPK